MSHSDKSSGDNEEPHWGLPDWIRQLGAAVWISGPDRRIWFMNHRAETLLGRSAGDCIGRACHQVIDSVDANGAPFCGAQCDWFCSAREGQTLEPQMMQVLRGDQERRWAQVMAIPVHSRRSDQVWLVHCAVDMDWSKRLEDYLLKVATRSASDTTGAPTRKRLTERESEVLGLLAQDLELPAVASRLHVSRVTVRNHVQHILAKLQVHSIQEAVALHVLGMVYAPRVHGFGGSSPEA